LLNQSVIYAGLLLAVSSAVLFAGGHRIPLRHWVWSQLMLAAMAALAWTLQWGATGEALPWTFALGSVLVVGTAVTAWCDEWSPPAHASLTAVILTVVSFLAYALFVLVEAHLGPVSLAFGGVLLALQTAVLLLLVAHTWEILDVVCRTTWRRPFGTRVVAGYTPKVSLHVPIHNEPPELVIATLDALARLDYPDYEVLVLDNNTADETLWRPVEAHCEALGPRFRFFHLMPWPGFKSGALNFGLTQVHPDTEIISIVDADYLVDPDYLKDLVGYFADAAIAFVQTPQDYRDADAGGRYSRALYLSYRYFFSISMASRNERNAIIFAGTMGLIRRSALTEAGGWDEWCITEDAEVSLRLLKMGHQSVFVDRAYGRGLMPLDYAALKKQRFRWAFGGMQLLRMHARALAGGRAAGHLTPAQRWAYLSGGLQWLNDPLTMCFTVVLLVAAGALTVGGSLYIQPLVGATVLVPPLLVLFGVMRFLWAFRTRERCTWREAGDSFVVLLGLTWVVTLACLQGLTARKGVFLRTPKLSEQPRLSESLRVVWLEGALALLCVAALAALLVRHPLQPWSAQFTLVIMLVWQMFIYASAVRTSVWSYAAQQPLPLWVRPAAGMLRLHPFLSEWQMSRSLRVGAVAFAGLFWVAVLLAPTQERVFRADPFGVFLPARSLIVSTPEDTVAAQLLREADAARRQDVRSALALWDPLGTIRDEMFTPDEPDDDRVWTGADQVRARYEEEFEVRRYRTLRHHNLRVQYRGADEAIVVNDLEAVFDTHQDTAHVQLSQSDRWTLRRRAGRWQIVMLEVNRAPRNTAGAPGALVTEHRRP
jgi:cellulose synthase/poly-beta-1,6-N-acetylglucosamine synthase-like glycosyltransferase